MPRLISLQKLRRVSYADPWVPRGGLLGEDVSSVVARSWRYSSSLAFVVLGYLPVIFFVPSEVLGGYESVYRPRRPSHNRCWPNVCAVQLESDEG
jgi:hypothetical protein